MRSIKAFVSNIKAKSAKISAEANEKKAKAKGFSSHQAYSTFKTAAEYDGKEAAQKKLRKKELDTIQKESYDDTMQGRSGKYRKYQKKVIKGIGAVRSMGMEYNEMMGELKSLGGSNPQSYGPPGLKKKPRSKKKGSKRKPQATKSKSRNKKNNFWDQFQ